MGVPIFAHVCTGKQKRRPMALQVSAIFLVFKLLLLHERCFLYKALVSGVQANVIDASGTAICIFIEAIPDQLPISGGLGAFRNPAYYLSAGIVNHEVHFGIFGENISDIGIGIEWIRINGAYAAGLRDFGYILMGARII